MTQAEILSNPQAGYRPGESFKTGSSLKRDRMASYVEWLLTPPEERVPSTKTALAEAMEVSQTTLKNYDREPFVQRELAERARAAFKVEKVNAILEALYGIATGEHASAAVSASKVLLDWLERTTDLRTEKINLEDLTEQEMVTAALEILKTQADRE